MSSKIDPSPMTESDASESAHPITHDLITFPEISDHLDRARSSLPRGVYELLSARLVERSKSEPIAGFRFGGTHAGIKRDPKVLDFGLIIAESGANYAGVYTQNQVVAAPVTLSREHLTSSTMVHGVIVNSGNANACTGEQGARAAHKMASAAASSLKSPIESIQVASTGVIGAPLPVDRLIEALPELQQSCRPDQLTRFATSIMTTDNRPKSRVVSLDLSGIEGAAGVGEIILGGCSKGAGMIHPNMATMLAYLCTDAPVSSEALRSLWPRVCDLSFNAITIDGDTSTNDTALCLASGVAPRVEPAQSGNETLSGEALKLFEVALTLLAQALAVDILRDGEGVEHVIALTVSGARNVGEARQIAETIGLSPLVKTAMNGCDPNWGRIIAAAGRSGVSIDPTLLSLEIGGESIYERGVWQGTEHEERAHQVMCGPEYNVELALGLGEAHFTLFMSDLSAAYVKINADYRS